MRIGNVVLHRCIRAHKIAWGLMEEGHTVHLVTERPIQNFGWRDYHSCCLIWTGHLDGYSRDMSQFQSTIEMLTPSVDVFHVHNEPDWIVKAVKDATSRPVIYDIHDMVSQRTGKVDEDEQAALDAADGLIVPSGVYREILQKRGVTKNIAEVLSCVPSKLFPTVRRKPERLGIVWEGGLKGKPQQKSEQFEFRSWAEDFQKISKMNIGVWAYPSDSIEDRSEYTNSGIIVMPCLPYDQLLKNLTAHEAGLVGSPFASGAFDGALPNKMFEYIAAGIPVIAYNAPTAANFLAATGFGVGIESLDEIPEVLDRFFKEETAKYVWEMRKFWTMEGQIQKVLSMYKKVCPRQYPPLTPEEAWEHSNYMATNIG